MKDTEHNAIFLFTILLFLLFLQNYKKYLLYMNFNL